VNASLISGLISPPAGIAIAPTTVPEPGTLPLLGLSFAIIGLSLARLEYRRRRKTAFTRLHDPQNRAR
jgi:hypothetical protein